jgi:hypothetical protein
LFSQQKHWREGIKPSQIVALLRQGFRHIATKAKIPLLWGAGFVEMTAAS